MNTTVLPSSTFLIPPRAREGRGPNRGPKTEKDSGPLEGHPGTLWRGSLVGKIPYGAHPVAITSGSATGGYWILVSNGGVSNFDAPWYGSPKATGDGPVTGIPSVPGGFGYFVSRSNGGIFTYGLPWVGSLAGRLPYGVSGIGVAG